MGGGLCSAFKSSETWWNNHKLLKPFKPTFDALKIPCRDIAQLHNQFREVDSDCSCEISLAEFFEFFGLEESRFGRRVFSIFDEDGSGELDFREFVVSLWNYCTFDKLALICFAFDLYDLDDGGSIDISEMEHMLEEVYGKVASKKNTFALNIKKKIKNMNQGMDPGHISKPEFINFCKKHPALLFPSFQMQKGLQKSVLGQSFWNRMARNRAAAFGDAQIDIDWLRSVVTKNGFIALVEGDEAGIVERSAATVEVERKKSVMKADYKKGDEERKQKLIEIRKKKAGRATYAPEKDPLDRVQANAKRSGAERSVRRGSRGKKSNGPAHLHAQKNGKVPRQSMAKMGKIAARSVVKVKAARRSIAAGGTRGHKKKEKKRNRRGTRAV